MFGALEAFLAAETDVISKQLNATIAQRPGFRRVYKHDPVKNDERGAYGGGFYIKKIITPSGETYKSKCAAVTKYAYEIEKMWFLLIQLLSDLSNRTRFRHDVLLDLLDDHLATALKDERLRLDEVLLEKTSDYIVLLELLRMIRMHWTNSIGRTLAACEDHEDRIGWRAKAYKRSWRQNDAMIKALVVFRTAHPPGGKRDKAWLKQFNVLHKSMQKYWKASSNAHRNMYKKVNLSDEDTTFAMQALLSWERPGYTARLSAKRAHVLTELDRSKPPLIEDIFLPLPMTIETPDTISTLDTKVKAKVKTRGKAQVDEQPDANPVPRAPTVTNALIIVSKRAYAAFRYMFPAEVEERQKTVDWTAFVNSMEEAGFTAQSRGGSMVGFEHCGEKGSIILHRPHPDPSLDSTILRIMGSCMNKRFGWTRESFVLATK